MTLFVFQWAIAFNSPVSVICGVGEAGGREVVGVGVRGFDKGSRPVLRTFDYRLVAGVGTFEFHPITDAILDWQLLKTWLPVI